MQNQNATHYYTALIERKNDFTISSIIACLTNFSSLNRLVPLPLFTMNFDCLATISFFVYGQQRKLNELKWLLFPSFFLLFFTFQCYLSAKYTKQKKFTILNSSSEHQFKLGAGQNWKTKQTHFEFFFFFNRFAFSLLKCFSNIKFHSFH